MNRKEYEARRLEAHFILLNKIPEICNGCNIPDVILDLELFKEYYLHKLKEVSEYEYQKTLLELKKAKLGQEKFNNMIDSKNQVKVEVEMFLREEDKND